MPLIVHLKSGTSYLIDGEQNPLDRPSLRRVIRTRNLKSGYAMIVRRSAIALCEVWPRAEFEEQQRAAAEAQAAGDRRNPRPGNEPRIVIPRKPS